MLYFELYFYCGVVFVCVVWCIVEFVSGVGCYVVMCFCVFVFKLCFSGVIVVVFGFGFMFVVNVLD